MRRHRPAAALIRIPVDVSFGDLDLAYDAADDAISMDGDVLYRVLEENGLDAEAIMADEAQRCRLLASWYEAHLAAGGERDIIMDLFASDIGPGDGSDPDT